MENNPYFSFSPRFIKTRFFNGSHFFNSFSVTACIHTLWFQVRSQVRTSRVFFNSYMYCPWKDARYKRCNMKLCSFQAINYTSQFFYIFLHWARSRWHWRYNFKTLELCTYEFFKVICVVLENKSFTWYFLSKKLFPGEKSSDFNW